MADSKDTGTGGINIDGDLYSVDVGVPDDQGGKQGVWSPGGVAVDQSVKDISKPTRETFAKYMSKTTTASAGAATHPNVYPADAVAVQSISIKDSDGNPLRPHPSPNTTKFSPSFDEQMGAPAPLPIRKGISSGNNPDGNELLKNAAVPADVDINARYVKPAKALSEPVNSYVSDILKNNRFTVDSKFYAPSSPGGDLPSPDAATFSNRYESGSSTKIQDPNKQYNFRRLAQVASVLQLRATGELSTVLSGGDNIDPNDPTVQLANLLPGLGQLDIPRNIVELSAADVINELTMNEINDSNLINPNAKFEGIINSVFDKFTGFSAQGMLSLAKALSAVVGIAIYALSFGFKTDGEPSSLESGKYNPYPENNNPGIGRHGVGTYLGGKSTSGASLPEDALGLMRVFSSGLSAFLGIKPVRRNYQDAVADGLKAFLETNSAGYNVVMARTIVRSAIHIIASFQELVKLFSSGNFVSGIAQIFEIIGAIKNSRFIAALNTFSQIGDRIADPGADKDVTTAIDSGLKISTIDKFPDNFPNASYVKSRLDGTAVYSLVGGQPVLISEAQPGTLKLAWSTNRAPSLLSVPGPNSALASAALLDPGRGSAAGLISQNPLSRMEWEHPDSMSANGSMGGRISTERREEFENKFDSEYMPFYFHDLRTNELLGFHAFLTSLNDDYTANYESTEAYGRVDPVKAYKSTSRKIGLSFLVVATSENDFQDMWVKINKLTTLVYPQYTAGKFLTPANGYTFAKPFSQTIGASPMIRLRLGNLLSSNFSKFNLAGIFGVNSPGAKLNNKTPALVPIPDFIETALTPDYKWIPKSRVYQLIEDPKTTALPAVTIGGQDEAKKTLSTINLAEYPDIFAMIIAKKDSNSYVVKFKAINAESLSPDQQVTLVKYHNDLSDGKVLNIDSAYFVARRDDFIRLEKNSRIDFMAKNARSEFNNEVIGLVNDDLKSPKSNAISRSFRSTGGKGLAGFIDSINFDWYGSTTWDIDEKAPKMCKVTISFTPIHDISPGLDSNGYNRAPVYRLGPYSRDNK